MDDATDEHYAMFLRRRGLRLRLGLEGRHGKGHGIAAIKALLDKLTLKGSLRGKYGCPVKSAGLIYRNQQTRYNSPVFPPAISDGASFP